MAQQVKALAAQAWWHECDPWTWSEENEPNTPSDHDGTHAPNPPNRVMDMYTDTTQIIQYF